MASFRRPLYLDSHAIRIRADRREAPPQPVRDSFVRIFACPRSFPSPVASPFRAWRVVFRGVFSGGAKQTSTIPDNRTDHFEEDDAETAI